MTQQVAVAASDFQQQLRRRPASVIGEVFSPGRRPSERGDSGRIRQRLVPIARAILIATLAGHEK